MRVVVTTPVNKVLITILPLINYLLENFLFISLNVQFMKTYKFWNIVEERPEAQPLPPSRTILLSLSPYFS